MSMCPIPGCDTRTQLGPNYIMCRRHWFMVPKEIRQLVWNEYRLSPGSPEHYTAVTEAFCAVMKPVENDD